MTTAMPQISGLLAATVAPASPGAAPFGGDAPDGGFGAVLSRAQGATSTDGTAAAGQAASARSDASAGAGASTQAAPAKEADTGANPAASSAAQGAHRQAQADDASRKGSAQDGQDSTASAQPPAAAKADSSARGADKTAQQTKPQSDAKDGKPSPDAAMPTPALDPGQIAAAQAAVQAAQAAQAATAAGQGGKNLPPAGNAPRGVAAALAALDSRTAPGGAGAAGPDAAAAGAGDATAQPVLPGAALAAGAGGSAAGSDPGATVAQHAVLVQAVAQASDKTAALAGLNPLAVADKVLTAHAPEPAGFEQAQLAVAANLAATSAAPGAAASATASPTYTAQLASQLGTQGWGEELGQQMLFAVNGRQQLAVLHLNPPQLGPLDVHLQMQDGQVNAQFVSPHQAVRQAVESALPQLHDMFTGAGLSLSQASVGSGDNGRGRLPQQARQGRGGGGAVGAVDEPIGAAPVAAAWVRGLVNTYV